MDPVCVHVGNRPIYWYGVMLALAFVAAIVHWRVLGRRDRRDGTYAADLAFWIMIGGVVGARVAYVCANLDYFLARPVEILRVDQGGLIYYGGLVGGVLSVVLFAAFRRQNAADLFDFVATALPLGHALGRVGCFLNGCCYGLPAPPPWGVNVHGESQVPVQLYEAVLNVGIYALLLHAYRHRGDRYGRVTALYLLTYPAVRFFLEFLRGDERVYWGPVTAAQALSLLLFLVGGALWRVVQRRHDHPAGTV